MTAPRAAEVVAEDVLGSPQDADPERPWHRPGVYAVAPGVFRIPLPLPDPGLHSVNAYIIDGPDGLVLIDPGQATSASPEHLLHGLEMLGRSPRDVRRILVTHVHRDHYTQAVALRRGGDLAVALGRQERRSLALVADPACDVITRNWACSSSAARRSSPGRSPVRTTGWPATSGRSRTPGWRRAGSTSGRRGHRRPVARTAGVRERQPTPGV